MEIELNHNDVATQLVYLVAGVEREIAKYQVTQRLLWNDAHMMQVHAILAGGGHTGMVADLMPYAKLVSAHIATMQAQDFPGVFEYQVTEHMGSWLARATEDQDGGVHAMPPMVEQFKEELARESEKFFRNE